MYIFFGREHAEQVKDKHIVLPLDRIQLSPMGPTLDSFCVLESVPPSEIETLGQWTALHSNLMKNYWLANFGFCEQAIDHLKGKFNGELDSFYDEITSRLEFLKVNPPQVWNDGILQKYRESDLPF